MTPSRQAISQIDVRELVRNTGGRPALSRTGQRVLDAFCANAQLYADWFGDPSSMFTPWHGGFVYGIPETSVKRGIRELIKKDYVRFSGMRKTFRTAPKQGRDTRVFDLVVDHHYECVPTETDIAYCERLGIQPQRYFRTKMRLRDYMRMLVGWGEIRKIQRMKTSVYRQRFGPIGSVERKPHLLLRFFGEVLIRTPSGKDPPSGAISPFIAKKKSKISDAARLFDKTRVKNKPRVYWVKTYVEAVWGPRDRSSYR